MCRTGFSRPLANRTEDLGKSDLAALRHTGTNVNINSYIINTFPLFQSLLRPLKLSHRAVVHKKRDCSPTFEDGTNSVRGDPPTGRDG
jgi:hypothetical protein